MNELPVVNPVDTEKFMGSWYVIAHIPPFLTDDAWNAIEHYDLADDGTVDVTYSYNEDGFDGERKVMTPTGFPQAGDQDGEWGMRFVWPFKADYRIVYLDDDYETTIIGRNKRDYVWIMARTPTIPEQRFQKLRSKVVAMGYDAQELRKVPQQPLARRSAKGFNPAQRNKGAPPSRSADSAAGDSRAKTQQR